MMYKPRALVLSSVAFRSWLFPFVVMQFFWEVVKDDS